MLPDDYENLSQSVIASNFFGNNILAAITTKDYWAVANEYKPLMHTWYVGVLMQFYMVYPILFFIARANKKKKHRTLLVTISTFAILSLLVYFVTTDDAQRFYYLPSRFFEFAAGGIIALTWKRNEQKKTINSFIAYVSYAMLVLLLAINENIIPTRIRLVAVVILSVMLIMLSTELENKFTGNGILAKIGAASYSIFLWHQVLLAFYRYTISSQFTIITYGLFIIVVAFLSWLTYYFIEQKTSGWLKQKESKNYFYAIVVAVFLSLNAFSGYIYLHAGVVRDVPELYIDKNDIHRGLHSEYNDKIYKLDRPFETGKEHWLIIGNSFGRDFINAILESDVADRIEVSYIVEGKHLKPSYAERFVSADKVFLSTLGIDEEKITKVEKLCAENGVPIENLIIVGEKNYGENNGQFYRKRNKPDYFSQRTKVNEGIFEKNLYLKGRYGERYLDMISFVVDEEKMVPVFTPDHHFISQDCYHFSKGGAVWYAKLIDWSKYLKNK